MIEPGYRLFYRIVRTNPATLADFTSNADKGRPVPDDPVQSAVWGGLSAYSTLAQARRKRRASPAIGEFIAVLRVPLDGSIRIERTLGGDGHHTLWGKPATLLSFVVSVERV